MHKILLILGLLFEDRPMSGYDINFILRKIGVLYQELKKANIYYLLDKLKAEGKLKMSIEQSEHGPQKEKFLYSITDEGKEYYKILLKKTFSTYDTLHSSIDVAIALIPHLDKGEVLSLLEERKKSILDKKEVLLKQREGSVIRGEFHALAFDHILHLTEADLSWLDKTILKLSENYL